MNQLLKIKIVIIFIRLIFLNSEVNSQIIQETVCSNSDFSLHNFNNWTGCYGGFTNPCITQGYATTRHTIITTPGTDIYTCGGLQKIPQGVNQVVRLGNSDVGAEAERLIYQISVDTNLSGLFVYNFAIVLEDPGGSHTYFEMPKFEIQILDQNGFTLFDTCSHFFSEL